MSGELPMDVMAVAPCVGESANDDLLLSRVSSALKQSSYPDLRRLQCDCHAGIVLLQGRVGSYFIKQMAQATIARVDGVRQIDNRLRVEAAPILFA